MFCPSCGKDNQETARFCRACGRSLAGLAFMHDPDSSTPLQRIELRLDEIIAHHTARYFKRTEPVVSPPSLKESWALLGKGYLAVFADLFYTWLIVQFVLQFRLWILIFKSPWQLFRELKLKRSRSQGLPSPKSAPQIPPAGISTAVITPLPVSSVTEEPTEPLSSLTEQRGPRTTGPR